MSIEPLNGKWGAKAASADAHDRTPNEAPFIALWLHPDKGWQWSKANTDFSSLSMAAQILNEFATACVREELND